MAITPAHDVIVAGLALGEDDGPVLALARLFARVTGAPLALVHAYPCELLVAVPPPRWELEMRAEALAALEALAAPLRAEAEVSVQARANPSPVRALHETAEELGASLLVVGVSRHARSIRALASGVGERLLHAAPCAVALPPPAYEAPATGLRRVGVAFVDGPEGAEALATAAGLAEASGGRVCAYTVLEAGAGAAAARAATREAWSRGRLPPDLLEATEALDGRPAEALAAVSAGLDLLVCGSRGYGPVRSMLLGSVSAELTRTTACPLLVVPRAPVPGMRALTGGRDA